MQGGFCKIGTFFGTSNCKILYLAYMSICSPNLTYSFFTIYKIITFKIEEKVFSPLPTGDSSLLGSKKITLSSRYKMSLFGFLFLGELSTCLQNLMLTRGVEPWENHLFLQGGMLKFTYKGYFLTIKIAYKKFLDYKSEWWKHALLPPLYAQIFILYLNTQISIFGGMSKFRLWTSFGNFGNFGQILLHLQWLRACPKQG